MLTTWGLFSVASPRQLRPSSAWGSRGSVVSPTFSGVRCLHAHAHTGRHGGEGGPRHVPTELTHGPAALTPSCLCFSQVAVADRAQGEHAHARQTAGGACATRGSQLTTGWVGAGPWGPVGAVLSREMMGGLADMGRPQVSPPWRPTAGPEGRYEPSGTDVSTDASTSSLTHSDEGLAVSVPSAHSPGRRTE